LITESLLKLGTSGTHQRVDWSTINSDSYPIQLGDSNHEMLGLRFGSLWFDTEWVL
jgi:hypothetical protein